MKKGWTRSFPVQFQFKGIDFTCNSSILIGRDGKVVEVGIFDLKPVDPGVKESAREAAKKVLETELLD